ncbi:MAG: hypothetical protein AWM53_00541 [Candidatus Dichloromethanomonas elyunquensis]|nr:MAG: hypothetical protein AWM53_00541 [Candidatus Dichloromethanomonas elyunquensis]
MNITDVLTLTNIQGNENKGKGNQVNGTGAPASGTDLNLFSVFLKNLTGIQTKASGQTSEEQKDDSVSRNDDVVADGFLGQNLYLQFLQNVFPAGKEANSGLMGDQSLSSINSIELSGGLSADSEGKASIGNAVGDQESNNLNSRSADAKNFVDGATQLQQADSDSLTQKMRTGNVAAPLDPRMNTRDYLSALSDLGLEGIPNPGSGESQSLDPQELDQYRKTFEQLQELSGKIEPVENKTGFVQPDKLSGVPVKPEFAKGPTEKADSPAADQTSFILGKANPLAAANAKGQSTPSGQDDSGQETHSSKHSEIQSVQPSATNPDGISAENKLNTTFKVPVEQGRVWEQVLDTLKKQEFRNNEVKELSIRLQPAELGKVDVSLRLENGQLHLVMNASEQNTGAMLQNHIQELRNGLTQMGVACGNFEMSYRQNEKNGSEREFSGNRSRYKTHLEEEAFPALAGVGSYLSADGSGGRINVSA